MEGITPRCSNRTHLIHAVGTAVRQERPRLTMPQHIILRQPADHLHSCLALRISSVIQTSIYSPQEFQKDRDESTRQVMTPPWCWNHALRELPKDLHWQLCKSGCHCQPLFRACMPDNGFRQIENGSSCCCCCCCCCCSYRKHFL